MGKIKALQQGVTRKKRWQMMIEMLIPKYPPSLKKVGDIEQMARTFLKVPAFRRAITRMNNVNEKNGQKPWIFKALENGDVSRKRDALLQCYWYLLEQARLAALQMTQNEALASFVSGLTEQQIETLNTEVPTWGRKFGHKQRKELLDLLHMVAKRYRAVVKTTESTTTSRNSKKHGQRNYAHAA